MNNREILWKIFFAAVCTRLFSFLFSMWWWWWRGWWNNEAHVSFCWNRTRHEGEMRKKRREKSCHQIFRLLNFSIASHRTLRVGQQKMAWLAPSHAKKKENSFFPFSSRRRCRFLFFCVSRMMKTFAAHTNLLLMFASGCERSRGKKQIFWSWGPDTDTMMIRKSFFFGVPLLMLLPPSHPLIEVNEPSFRTINRKMGGKC